MNWTTTTVPLWQIDCDSYRKTGRDFELRDVTTPEHLRFAEVFAARYDLSFEMTGTTIHFLPFRSRVAPQGFHAVTDEKANLTGGSVELSFSQLCVNNPVTDGKTHKVCLIGEVQLFHQVRAMAFYSSGAYEELHSDLRVR